MFHQIKIVVASLLALLVLVIILQNTEPVETQLLFMTVTMPRAVLLVGTFIIAFLIGALWATRHPIRK